MSSRRLWPAVAASECFIHKHIHPPYTGSLFTLFFLVLWGQSQLQTSWLSNERLVWMNHLNQVKCFCIFEKWAKCCCWMGPSSVPPARAEIRSKIRSVISGPKHIVRGYFPLFFPFFLSLSAVLHLLCVKQFSGMPKALTFSSCS